MIDTNDKLKPAALKALALSASIGLMSLPLQAGFIESNADAPVPEGDEVYLYNQPLGIESGKIIALKKLLKDVQDYPDNGSASVLLSFTIEGSGTAMIKSLTVQISKSDMALGDNASLEIALYKNENADADFMASEVMGDLEIFDAAGFTAADGDFVTLTFAEPLMVDAGYQYGFALHWTLDSVAPDSVDIDTLNLRLARSNDGDPAPGEGFILLNPPKMAPVSFPPDYTNLQTNDPVLIVIGELQGGSGGNAWGGIAAEASDPNLFNTEDWMGFLTVDGDWAYSWRLSKWIYAPDPGAEAAGVWIYAAK